MKTRSVYRLFWIAIAAVLGLFVLLPTHRPVHACTAPAGGLPAYTVADRTNDADLVFEGDVIAVDSEAFPNVATIAVTAYYKGTGPAGIIVRGYGDSSVCLSRIAVDDYFVFYVDSDDAGVFRASYLSQFDAVDPANRETVEQILAVTETEPFFPQFDDGAAEAESEAAGDENGATPVDSDEESLVPLFLFGGAVVCLLIVLPLLIVLAVLRWRGVMPGRSTGESASE